MSARNVNIYIPAGKSVFYANFRVKEKDARNPTIIRTKQVNRSTGSPDSRTAQRIANGMRDKALEGLFHTVPKLRDDSPTCGKLVDTYLASSRIATSAIVARNFLIVVAEGSGILDDSQRARALRVNNLSAEVMQAFRDGTKWPADHPGKPVRTPSTVNAIMRSARSIFARMAREFYRELALDDVAISDWLSVSFLKDKSDKTYRQIPQAVLDTMDQKAAGMLRLARWHERPQTGPRRRMGGNYIYPAQWRNAWATYWLIRRCGLRNVEVENLRWDWFVERDGRLMISLVERDYWSPKGTSGEVPVARDLYASLLEQFAPSGKPVKGPGGFVLHGTATDRHRGANNCVNAFVRRHLPDRIKGVYELRKQWGSIIAQKHGIETASKLLRHQDIKTTMDHYYDLLKLHTIEAL